MRVALYARVSTGKQAKEDLPLPSQIKELREYARKNGYTVLEDHIYIDGGRSGTSTKREEFQRMIEAAKGKPRPFDAILVWKFSRFARNREDSIIYKALLKKRGVQVISINEPVDDTPAGQMLEGIIEVVDEFYSRNLGQDIKRGLKEIARRGFFTGGPIPYGYTTVSAMDGDIERTKFSIDEPRASIVKEIFSRYARGEGARAIAEDLNRRGIRPMKAKHWSLQVILQMLDNEKYTGVMTYADEEGTKIRHENAHPAIISRELFEKVQRLRKERRNTPSGTLGSRHLLSGLVRCGLCGGPMHTVKHSKKDTSRAYRCKAYHGKGKVVCAGITVQSEKVERTVLAELRRQFLKRACLESLVRNINAKISEALKNEREASNALQQEIEDLKRRRAKLYEALETGTFKAEDLAPRITELNNSIREREQQLEKVARARTAEYFISSAEVQQFLQGLEEKLTTGSVQERRALLSKVIDHIVVFRDTVRIIFKAPYESSQKVIQSPVRLVTESPGWAPKPTQTTSGSSCITTPIKSSL
jgi:DNA invertase Pin-like site-specific DNA recombinase